MTAMKGQTETVADQDRIVWRPTDDEVAKSHLESFRKKVGLPSLDDLYAMAVRDPNWFWGEVCADLGIEFMTKPKRYYQTTDDPTRPIWCVDATMNIVASCTDKWVTTGQGDRTALRCEWESGKKEDLSYNELHKRVCLLTGVLRKHGIRQGDVVALMMPMDTNVVVSLLAVARCGAIALPLFSGFGRAAIETRLIESGARFGILSPQTVRRGKSVDLATPFGLAAMSSSMEKIFYWGENFDRDAELWGKFEAVSLEQASHQVGISEGSAPTPVDAEAPLMLIFTSGTTGRPKGAVHTHCGFPIKAAQDMRHAMNLGPDDTIHWVSDIGWMMGPWVIFGSLIGGMTLALYDGAPDYPSIGRIWSFVAEQGVTFLGLSPALARIYRAAPELPNLLEKTKSLKAIGSTGSPWDRDSWLWVFEKVLGSQKPIINYSGGTEISGGILCGNWHTPLKPCSFSGPVIGMDADVFGVDGKPLRGQPGELVVRNHWIGMTRGFWKNDPRYHSAYWERFPGVWTHGDFASIDDDGLWSIVGRSDDTIKVAGKRLGPAEVETIVNSFACIRESAAIGVADEKKGEALIVYCVPRQSLGESEREDLRIAVKLKIASELGKPLAPREVWFVEALPKTRNAKIMHRLIRAVHDNLDPGDVSSLEDRQTIDMIRGRI